MLCCELAHFAGPDDHDRLAGQIAEDLPRQFHGCVADGNRRLRNARFAANFLRYRERAIHERAQVHPDGAGIGCDPVGFLHLAEDLRLADHH